MTSVDIVRGPRGMRFVVSLHARERWAERFAEPLTELAHAVRFSRVIATSPDDKKWLLWYEPDAALFIATRTGTSFNIVTCFSGTVLTLQPSRNVNAYCALIDSYCMRARHVEA